MSSRAERVRAAFELRDEGLTGPEIAEALGVSLSYVRDMFYDPDGSKKLARVDSYRRPCPVCGRPMDGSSGRRVSPKTCKDCVPSTRVWTRELIVESFQAFHRLTGRAPTTTDTHSTSPSVRRKLSPERLAEIEAARELIYLPTPSIVGASFPSWRHAVEAAGLEPAPTGGASHRGRRIPRRSSK